MDATICLAEYLKQGYSQEPRFRYPDLLAFTSAEPCIVTGELGVDCHHVVYKSRGRLASDLFVVPLKHELHMELHKIGEEAFQAKYNVNLEACIVRNIQRFLLWLLDEPIKEKAKARVRSRTKPKAEKPAKGKPEAGSKRRPNSKLAPYNWRIE